MSNPVSWERKWSQAETQKEAGGGGVIIKSTLSFIYSWLFVSTFWIINQYRISVCRSNCLKDRKKSFYKYISIRLSTKLENVSTNTGWNCSLSVSTLCECVWEQDDRQYGPMHNKCQIAWSLHPRWSPPSPPLSVTGDGISMFRECVNYWVDIRFINVSCLIFILLNFWNI